MTSVRDKLQERKEKTLFYLLLFVTLLTFIQVIPREVRRILELLYPYANLREKIDNPESLLPLGERFRLLRILYYGHIWTKIWGNLCTFINRSCNFYLYFLFNSAFRKEVIHVVRGLWVKLTAKKHNGKVATRVARNEEESRNRKHVDRVVKFMSSTPSARGSIVALKRAGSRFRHRSDGRVDIELTERTLLLPRTASFSEGDKQRSRSLSSVSQMYANRILLRNTYSVLTN